MDDKQRVVGTLIPIVEAIEEIVLGKLTRVETEILIVCLEHKRFQMWLETNKDVKRKRLRKKEMKRLLSIVALSLCMGCGVSTPNGYTLGTTGYLQEANKLQMRIVKLRSEKVAAQYGAAGVRSSYLQVSE